MDAKNKNSLIGGLLAIVFVMAVGYAVFAGQLSMGTTTLNAKWDVHIKSITAGTPQGSAKSESAIIGMDKLSASFVSSVKMPGDEITYTIEVENSGTIDAKLNNIKFKESNIAYNYSAIKENDIITAGNNQIFTVTLSYDKEATDKGLLDMNLSFVQAN